MLGINKWLAEGRVENQKLKETAALLSFGWVLGFQLDSLEKHLITLAVVTFTPRNKQKMFFWRKFWKYRFYSPFRCKASQNKNPKPLWVFARNPCSGRLVEILVFNLQPFRRQMTHFLTDMSNRDEHQKLNQTTAELSFGWLFGVQLGLRHTTN